MVELTLVQAVNQALFQEMERDGRVLVLGEDVGADGGVFRATEGLLAKFGPSRVRDTPLSELGIVGTSIGLAVAGLRPVAEIQFEGFTYAALSQLISHAARLRNRTRGKYHVPLVVRAPYGGGIHAPEHHSEAPETYFAHTPGLSVVIPSTPFDAKGLLAAAIRGQDPVVFFEPKRIYRSFKQEVPEQPYTIPIGKASVLREGDSVTVVSWGAMARLCFEAAAKLEAEKISVELIDLRTISPWDEAAVLESVEKTGRCVVVHEAPKQAGFGAEIAATIAEKDVLDLEAPVGRVAGWDVPMPLYKLENFYLPSLERITAAIKKTALF